MSDPNSIAAMNNSSKCMDMDKRVWPQWEIIATVLPLSAITIYIIIGNFLVILAILWQKNLRTPSNVYIISLALTDVLVGVFILPLNIYDMTQNHRWPFGKVICRIWLTSDVTLCSSSILHISAIAVDRFRSINEGLQYAQSKTMAMSLVVCGSLWFLSLWIASPPVLGWNNWELDCPEKCVLTSQLGYIIHSASGAFFIPAFVMVGLYMRIFFLLRRKFRERAKINCINVIESHEMDHSSDTGTRHSSGNIIDETESETDAPATTQFNKDSDVASSIKKSKSLDGHAKGSTKLKGGTLQKWRAIVQKNLSRDESSQGSSTTIRKPSEQISEIMKNKIKFSLTKERRATQTLGILIGAFLVCWTPFTITYLISGIGVISVHPKFFQFVTWLGYVNSGVNPVIYTYYNPEFKRAFEKIVLFWRN